MMSHFVYILRLLSSSSAGGWRIPCRLATDYRGVLLWSCAPWLLESQPKVHLREIIPTCLSLVSKASLVLATTILNHLMLFIYPIVSSFLNVRWLILEGYNPYYGSDYLVSSLFYFLGQHLVTRIKVFVWSSLVFIRVIPKGELIAHLLRLLCSQRQPELLMFDSCL